jgi:hypothetical protein
LVDPNWLVALYRGENLGHRWQIDVSGFDFVTFRCESPPYCSGKARCAANPSQRAHLFGHYGLAYFDFFRDRDLFFLAARALASTFPKIRFSDLVILICMNYIV